MHSRHGSERDFRKRSDATEKFKKPGETSPAGLRTTGPEGSIVVFLGLILPLPTPAEAPGLDRRGGIAVVGDGHEDGRHLRRRLELVEGQLDVLLVLAARL